MNEILKLRNIDTSYGKKQILYSVSMNMMMHDRLLLIGSNGAGKSTLLKTIIGLIKTHNGSIIFHDEDVTKSSVFTRTSIGIAYLLQSNNIVPDLTVEENLALGGFSLSRDEYEERRHQLLECVKMIRNKIKTRAGLLSGGERQLLALSMVLMRNPRVLLLDEPSAGLAPKTAEEVIEVLNVMLNTIKVEVVCMVEHNLKLSLNWANKISIMVQGQVVTLSDNPKELIKNPEEIEKIFFNMHGKNLHMQ